MEIEQQKPEKVFCKKLTYGIGFTEPSIILGIIEGEDNDFLFFRTHRKRYTISKKLIISIMDTNQEFIGGDAQ